MHIYYLDAQRAGQTLFERTRQPLDHGFIAAENVRSFCECRVGDCRNRVRHCACPTRKTDQHPNAQRSDSAGTLKKCATPLGWLVRSQPILGYANQLALRYPLRAYDAMHLATALALARASSSSSALPSPIFVSADTNLLAAARAEGLAVENPSEHE